MASLYLLIPVAIIFVVIAVALFLWAVRNRQFDDLDREGQRILFDSDEADARKTHEENITVAKKPAQPQEGKATSTQQRGD